MSFCFALILYRALLGRINTRINRCIFFIAADYGNNHYVKRTEPVYYTYMTCNETEANRKQKLANKKKKHKIVVLRAEGGA